MMNAYTCEQARQEMLAADLEELRGETESPLAAHVRACAGCRQYAARILGGQAALGRGLDALQPQAGAGRRRPSRAWRRARAPLAAAAVLALMLVGRQNREPMPNIEALTRLMFPQAPLVAPPAGKQAMIIEKDNMTIVWLYEEERQ